MLDFLNAVDSDYLYLVGDIIDLWSIRRSGLHWLNTHSEVIPTVLPTTMRRCGSILALRPAP